MLTKNTKIVKTASIFVVEWILAYNLRAIQFSGELVKAESCRIRQDPKNLMRIIPTKGEKQ